MPLQPDDLINRHDPHLPAWGPYTKGYIGISHCANMKRGARFDLSVFPGLYRRATRLPNVRTEAGYHPWEVSANLEYVKHRHEILWKDQLYCDIAFSQISENARLIEIEAVNNGQVAENMALHYMANLTYPPPAAIGVADAPETVTILRGLDFQSLQYREHDIRRYLQWDGHKRGEVCCTGALEGFALGIGQGERATIHWKTPQNEASVHLRYYSTDAAVIYDQNETKLADAPAADNWTLLPLGTLAQPLTISIDCQGVFYLDAVILGDTSQVSFREIAANTTPQIEQVGENCAILSYEHVDHCYGLLWPVEIACEIRTFATDTLEELFRESIHNHVTQSFTQGENPANCYANVFLRPLCMEPGTTRTLRGLVCNGSREEVFSLLETFSEKESDYLQQAQHCRDRCYHPRLLPGGDELLFSQECMAATTLSNVVFPIRTRGQYIRHYTPGRWWDCLYTWDSGCIGIGQLELDINRAIENLNAYITEPDDKESAFIHHGSPVPTQFCVFHGIWSRTQDKTLLQYFYPRLKQYHDFLMGRIGGSTTRTLKSGLLRTWDYFYNSGGWDDYPPQQHVHTQSLQTSVTPVINSAFAIRTAKILLQAATALGENTREHKEDIETLTAALQQYTWDAHAGYFSYLCHDNKGTPQAALRHESGENFNCGLDGVSPLIADICTPEQQATLIGKLMDEKHLWCTAGLSTVDQSAGYYRRDGYWNGAVWLPHQWFLWKALLDHGKLQEAWRIAETALCLWAHEVGESYNCFEHFLVETGRGAGWHHFSGLSAPILSWFASYYTEGILTTGFNAWIEHARFSADNTALEAELSFLDSPNPPAVIVTLNPQHTYLLQVNGAPHTFATPVPGRLEILLPDGCNKAQLVIRPV